MRALGLILLLVLGSGTVASANASDIILNKKAAKKAWRSNPRAKTVFKTISNMQGIYKKRATRALLDYANKWPQNALALDFLSVFSKEGGAAAVNFMESHLSESYRQYMQNPNAPESKSFYSNLRQHMSFLIHTSLGSYHEFSRFLFLSGDVCASKSLNSVINFFFLMQDNTAKFFRYKLLDLVPSPDLASPAYAREFFAHRGFSFTSFTLREKNDKFYNHEQCVEHVRELTHRLICPKYFAFESSKPESEYRTENLEDTKAFCKKRGIPIQLER